MVLMHNFKPYLKFRFALGPPAGFGARSQTRLLLSEFLIFNPLASAYAGAPALKYGNVNTVTTSPGEVKGLIKNRRNFLIVSIL
jgi:hypothetical protein